LPPVSFAAFREIDKLRHSPHAKTVATSGGGEIMASWYLSSDVTLVLARSGFPGLRTIRLEAFPQGACERWSIPSLRSIAPCQLVLPARNDAQFHPTAPGVTVHNSLLRNAASR
jgi:hypothetical protein